MPSARTTVRLQKEFKMLCEQKRSGALRGVTVQQDKRNSMVWHFLFDEFEESSPYYGGEYHGIVTYPEEYPLKPPNFKFLTPSGRFQPRQSICFSMSDFHPESWNPLWNMVTVLLGVKSFMLGKRAPKHTRVLRPSGPFNGGIYHDSRGNKKETGRPVSATPLTHSTAQIKGLQPPKPAISRPFRRRRGAGRDAVMCATKSQRSSALFCRMPGGTSKQHEGLMLPVDIVSRPQRQGGQWAAGSSHSRRRRSPKVINHSKILMSNPPPPPWLRYKEPSAYVPTSGVEMGYGTPYQAKQHGSSSSLTCRSTYDQDGSPSASGSPMASPHGSATPSAGGSRGGSSSLRMGGGGKRGGGNRGGSSSSSARIHGGHGGHHGGHGHNSSPGPGGGNGSTPASLSLITCTTGDALLFSETNLDWSKLNIFRTRLCDRLTQTRTCHMANRCLFSHEVNWLRRTPFLPRASALTLRYIPVWCPRLNWPPLKGVCDSSGKVSWSAAAGWNGLEELSKCPRGDNCPFVHSIEEFLYHPEVYKTRRCCLANDDNFDEEIHNNCVAFCPWYFCPFAHDAYEIRDTRAARYAWHPPPQIVDNQYVARTQGFDALEMAIIEFVRKSPHELYVNPSSPLWGQRLPPVLLPGPGSSLEALPRSPSHIVTDELLYLMAVASLLNLILYPVENFYIPSLLSLQCALLHFHLGVEGDASTLIAEYERRAAGELQTAPDELAASLADLVPPADASTVSTNSPSSHHLGSSSPTSSSCPDNATALDLQNLIDLLKNEDILKMVLEGQLSPGAA